MNWLVSLFQPGAAAHASAGASLLILCLVAALGLALGRLKIAGVGLGVAGVLFVGIGFGHFGLGVAPAVLEFAREFGLILFVFTIGLQVGPGFFGSLRRSGLKLNALAAAIVLLGAALTVALWQLSGLELPTALGLFSGATTSTPSLAAAQQAMRERAVADSVYSLVGLGYAVAYPFGVLGIILTMVLLRRVFRIDLAEEGKVFLRSQAEDRPRLHAVNLEVRAPSLQDVALESVPLPAGSGVVFSRVLHGGAVRLATPETRLAVGDTVLAVGPREQLEAAREVFGAESSVDLRTVPSPIVSRPVVVTQKAVLGRRITGLDLLRRHQVAITRVQRADVELPVSPEVRLQFGDRVIAVGEPASIAAAAAELGDSLETLNRPMLVPVFAGIALGVALGALPLPVPGMPVPLKLGLAGGPLLVAILLGRIGRIGPLIWYLPSSANAALRDLGISLFLASVGLSSGSRFVATLTQGGGARWIPLAAVITVVPLLVIGLVARRCLRLNFMTLCGLLAGSMTDTPALAFATGVTGSEGPSIAYATVYPLTMFLRVICAQLMVLLF